MICAFKTAPLNPLQRMLMVVAFFISIIIGGCIPNSDHYGGGSVGSIAMPGSDMLLCYVAQYDKTDNSQGDLKEHQEKKPLFCIMWKARRLGTVIQNNRNIFVSINGNSIGSISANNIYALQQDYSLKKIPLTNDEVDHIFNLVCGQNDDSIQHDQVWKSKVKPCLVEVEDQ